MFATNRREWIIVALSMAACMFSGRAGDALAHEGPPFPLFMDKALGDVRLSLWADPDIGDARFFVVVETLEGSVPPRAPRVALWTEPTSGRLGRETYTAQRQSLRNQMQFEAKPYFDQRDNWKVGVRLIGADGREQELVTEVESTPPGLGYWDLAIYLFPFVLLGGLWMAAMVRGRRSLRDRFEFHATATAAAAHGHDDSAATDGAQ